MAKNIIPSELPAHIVEIKSVITYKGEVVESAFRLDVNDIAKIASAKGAKAVNDQIGSVMQAFLNKANDNLKSILNK